VEDTASAMMCLRDETAVTRHLQALVCGAALDIIVAAAAVLVAIIVCYPILLLAEAIKERPKH
jgi:hypothetical protein